MMKAVVLNCIDVAKLDMKMKRMMTVVWRVSRMKCDLSRMIWCFLMLPRGRSVEDVAQLTNEWRVVRVEVESGEMREV